MGDLTLNIVTRLRELCPLHIVKMHVPAELGEAAPARSLELHISIGIPIVIDANRTDLDSMRYLIRDMEVSRKHYFAISS